MSLDPASYFLKDNIYLRSESSTFQYSDGDFYEKKMLALLRQIEDVSTQSVEIFKHLESWVLEYHFSPLRQNLLRGLALKNFENVLELGSGCGAITRQLGEQCQRVTCVEGSFQRALIGAERCRDLENVSIFCDNFQNVSAASSFDLITMIGVLEYAPLFIEGDDPVQQILQKFTRFLSDEGVLLIAIENQLGLKYFNGCSEDHVGHPFFGINDLYHNKTAVTFGHQELKQRLLRAGFARVEFLFPFPDYKLPRLLIREQALEFPKLDLGALIGQFPGRDYTGRSARHFSEHLCWPVLARNQLIPHFSNSFLIAASMDSSKSLFMEDWLLKIYNLGRKPAYCVESTFLSQSNSLCSVQKKPLFPEQKACSSFVSHTFLKEPYIAGRHMGDAIAKGLLDSSWHRSYLNELKSWVNYLRQYELKQESTPAENSWHLPSEVDSGRLPGNLIDCIPRNLIDDGTQWQYIDQEWTIQTPIPIIWVVFRGILFDICDHLTLARHSPILKEGSVQKWMIQTMEQLGFFLGKTSRKKRKLLFHLMEWEIRFQLEVTDQEEASLRSSLYGALNTRIGIEHSPSLVYLLREWLKQKLPQSVKSKIKQLWNKRL